MLETATFPFPALAGMAARAALGGDRETALACFMLARLCLALLPPAAIGPSIRGARAAAARSWLTSLALPAQLRAACLRLAEATAIDSAASAKCLQEVIAVTATSLESGAHSELVRLAERLRA